MNVDKPFTPSNVFKIRKKTIEKFIDTFKYETHFAEVTMESAILVVGIILFFVPLFVMFMLIFGLNIIIIYPIEGSIPSIIEAVLAVHIIGVALFALKYTYNHVLSTFINNTVITKACSGKSYENIKNYIEYEWGTHVQT